MPGCLVAKAKVAGSNPVFRSKLPGFRVVSVSGHFRVRRLARRRRRVTTVDDVGTKPVFLRVCECAIFVRTTLRALWNTGGTFARQSLSACCLGSHPQARSRHRDDQQSFEHGGRRFSSPVPI